MGTTYSFSGSIEIEPPLNYSQLNKLRANTRAMVAKRYSGKPPRWVDLDEETFDVGLYMPLKPEVSESVQETEEGVLYVKRVSRIVPSGGSLSYSMADQINQLIKLFPGHVFTGSVAALDEEDISATKVVIKDGAARDVEGKGFIHFDDGEQVSVSSLT